MFDHPPLPPARHLLLIIGLLQRALGGCVARPGRPGLPDALLMAIWKQLGRLAGRITRLAAKIDAGEKPPPPRRRPPRPARPRSDATPPDPAPSGPPPVRLPRGKAWLVGLVGYNAAAGASQFRHLLAQPHMAPLLADPRMGRLLRPLCHMLGVTPPPQIARPQIANPGIANPGIARPRPITPAAPPGPEASPPPRTPAPAPRSHPSACGPPPLPA